MAVDSYLELFTTLFGWQWYGVIWDVLSDTGIIYIPFAVMIIETWRKAARGGSYGNVHDLALRSLEIEFYVAIFVALIAGPPTVTLAPSALRYQPAPTLTNPHPTTATPSAPQSNYGTAGAFSGAPSSVKIPVWWYTVLSLSKGFNHAILAGIPDATGIRQVQQQATLTTITDPKVREEAAQFYAECFVPARSKYLRDKPSSSTITDLLDEYGKDDPDWMGSHVLRATYYANMRSMRQVAGWPYDSHRDVDYDPDLPHQWGQPTCEQWWVDADNGLRAKIVDLPEASTLRNVLAAAAAYFASWFPSTNNIAEKTTDMAARKSLDNSRVEAMTAYQPDDLGTYSGRDSVADNIYSAAQDVSATAGAAVTHFTLGTMLTAMKPMLPIAQALLLMIVYALLPLIVVISRYSLSMLALAGLGIFTINFWSVLWKLAQWIDENLTVAMHPGTLDGFLDWANSPGGLAGATTKSLLLDIMLAMMMIGMPVIWTVLMGWVGIRVGTAMDNALTKTTNSSEQAGNKGSGMASKMKR